MRKRINLVTVFGIRSKKSASLKVQREGIWSTAVVLGSLGVHDFVNNKVLHGVIHLVLLIISLVLKIKLAGMVK